MYKKATYLAAAFTVVFGASAHAVTLASDGQWNVFDVDDLTAVSGGLEWIDLDGEALHFSFTLTTPGVLRIVDAGFSGDRFEIFEGVNSLGLTSVSQPGAEVGLDFDSAIAAPGEFSYAVLHLMPGSYSISGMLVNSALDEFGNPINATVGAVSLTPVPLPAAGLLFAVASGLLGMASRRRAA